MRSSVIMLCLLWALPVAARMYRWTNPDTGTAQLAGAPPAWYRAAHGGPRVLVFERGQLIDDTSIQVSEVQRESLRSDAFGTPATSPARIGSAAVPAAHPEPTVPPALAPTHTPVPAEASSAAKASVLKAMIDAWDQRQLDQARSLLELVPDTRVVTPVAP